MLLLLVLVLPWLWLCTSVKNPVDIQKLLGPWLGLGLLVVCRRLLLLWWLLLPLLPLGLPR